MARSASAGQPAIIRAGCYDATASKEMLSITCNGNVDNFGGSADALTFPGIANLTTAGVNATTLATPLSGPQPIGDDGKTLVVYDSTGNAHTITVATNKFPNSKHIATFNGTAGSCCVLTAVAGLWVPVVLTGVSMS